MYDLEEIIKAIITEIGDDPNRSGLVETPKRVINSWGELFCGYYVDIPSLFKTFDDAHQYDELVLMKNIEFQSFCEHHMLPFVGEAHVAYIPGTSGKVVGASKLARVVDAYARRLQMQERIGQQVIGAIWDHLSPTGVACIIEAKHLCMSCRGVNKQQSSMVTSSLAGVFKKDQSARAELLSLIGLRL